MTPQRRGLLLAASGLAIILIATLWPIPGAFTQAPSLCVLCGEQWPLDLALNILLFIPLGAGLGVANVRARRAIAFALVITVTVELLQIRAIPGRDASLGDVVWNTCGGALGWWIGNGWRWWVLPGARRARRLLVAGCAAWLAIVGATSWLLVRSLPRSQYWGQWAPVLGHLDRFRGRLLAVDVAGQPLPTWIAPDSRALRARLLADRMLVRATILPGGATAGLAPIAAIHDAYRRQIFILGQEGRDLIFTIRLREDDAGLRRPAVRLPDALPAAASSDTVHVAGGVIARALLARVETRAGTREQWLPLGPGVGWYALSPVDHELGREWIGTAVLWLAVLAFPLGWWAARSASEDGRAQRAWLVLPVIVMAGGLAALPSMAGAHAATAWDWVGAALGLATGVTLGARRWKAREPDRMLGR